MVYHACLHLYAHTCAHTCAHVCTDVNISFYPCALNMAESFLARRRPGILYGAVFSVGEGTIALVCAWCMIYVPLQAIRCPVCDRIAVYDVGGRSIVIDEEGPEAVGTRLGIASSIRSESSLFASSTIRS